MAGKRKREGEIVNGEKKKQASSAPSNEDPLSHITIQIITGSYERALHGFTATIPRAALNSTQEDHTSESAKDASKLENSSQVSFTDTFLLNAHRSSLTSLALCPPSTCSSKITLATGSSDAQIQLYSLSTSPPSGPSPPPFTTATLAPHAMLENPKNRELGSLLHHGSTITALHFPTHGKLLSASLDNSIGVTRTRDWTLLSRIRAPVPKPVGRPSGDTAAPGEVPAGVNGVAVHPSMKLCVSVGRGERCMRLWNLVTGKKAGVLSFGKELLARVGEGKFGRGEGLSVVWDEEGDEFAVGFERGIVVYELDARPRCTIVPSPRTKVGRLRYLPAVQKQGENGSEVESGNGRVLACTTEDGRVMFYDTAAPGARKHADAKSDTAKENGTEEEKSAVLLGQLGGRAAGVAGRIKDFKILDMTGTDMPSWTNDLLIATASSDGVVRVWGLNRQELPVPEVKPQDEDEAQNGAEKGTMTANLNGTATVERQIGKLLGLYETGHRITCLEAFVMSASTTTAEDVANEADAWEGVESSSSDEEEVEDE